MRNHQLAAVCLFFAVTAHAGQTSRETSAPSIPTTSKAVTLVGCVAGKKGGDELTFDDTKHKTTYRLTGSDLREYIGRRVQIAGTADSSRVQIAGGLLPTPNVAAQAGAIDPTRAAVATASAGIGTSQVQLPEFRVKSVRRLDGSCPKQ